MRPSAPALPALLLLLALLPSSPRPAAALEASGWGRDINPGQAEAVLAEARPGLLAILKASPADRPARIEAFLEKARWTSEAWKRFRNPELKPLFLRLAEDPDWTAAHRALFALDRYGGDDVLRAAWKHLFHAERRMREKAALTCLRTWSAKGAKDLSQGDWKGALAALVDTEKDPHVRAALEALRKRAEGKLAPQQVHEEFTIEEKDGLRWTPFLSGMDQAKRVAPGYAAKGVSQAGGGRLPPPAAWTTPLLGYGEEEVKGTSLQPFANPRENGVVHTGQDVGACMDGSGYYAAAEGVVRLVHSGSDMGTLLVLEHALDAKRLACAVYMHGGDQVFVKGGDKVAAGQLIGTMGTGFSLENGGHFAHLHYGLYPGPFQGNHNYGYKRKADGLRDWLDPAKCLPLWRDMGAAAPGEAPEATLARAGRVRRAGYPGRALEILKEGGPDCAGTLREWKSDPSFTAALKAEPSVAALEQTFPLGQTSADLEKKWSRAAAALLASLAPTELAPRLE